jgi:hypothetical protein
MRSPAQELRGVIGQLVAARWGSSSARRASTRAMSAWSTPRLATRSAVVVMGDDGSHLPWGAYTAESVADGVSSARAEPGAVSFAGLRRLDAVLLLAGGAVCRSGPRGRGLWWTAWGGAWRPLRVAQWAYLTRPTSRSRALRCAARHYVTASGLP